MHGSPNKVMSDCPFPDALKLSRFQNKDKSENTFIKYVMLGVCSTAHCPDNCKYTNYYLKSFIGANDGQMELFANFCIVLKA